MPGFKLRLQQLLFMFWAARRSLSWPLSRLVEYILRMLNLAPVSIRIALAFTLATRAMLGLLKPN